MKADVVYIKYSLLAVLAFGLGYYCRIQTRTHFECAYGFRDSLPTAASAKRIIRCEDPEFEIACKSSTYKNVGGDIECESADKHKYLFTNIWNVKNTECTMLHGDHSSYSKIGCMCESGYELIQGTCLSRNLKCAFLGEHGVAVYVGGPTDGEWRCGCADSYELAQDSKSCVNSNDKCKEKGFGIVYSTIRKGCVCDLSSGLVLNDTGDRCVCGKDMSLLNGVCVHDRCGPKRVPNKYGVCQNLNEIEEIYLHILLR